jgi:nuclear pore complex protein Nup133
MRVSLSRYCSWDAIRKTANISDAELNGRFRSTALYSTLCAILPRDYQPEGYETLPDVALMIPSGAEITSRWPGMPPDQVEAVIQDYNLECDRLGELDLNDVYHRVRELAAHDVVWQATQ